MSIKDETNTLSWQPALKRNSDALQIVSERVLFDQLKHLRHQGHIALSELTETLSMPPGTKLQQEAKTLVPYFANLRVTLDQVIAALQ